MVIYPAIMPTSINPSEAELRAIKVADVSELRTALIQYGIPGELIFPCGGENLALYNNPGQGLIRKTGDGEWGFTQFPEGYLDGIKQDVDKARTEGRLESYISSVVGHYQTMIAQASQIGMGPNQAYPAPQPETVEGRIARFLEQHGIIIVPEYGGVNGTLHFMQVNLGGGTPVDLGRMVYDTTTGIAAALITDGESVEIARKRSQLPGFVTQVIRPLARLLKQAEGDFNNDRFDPIHDALTRVESGGVDYRL